MKKIYKKTLSLFAISAILLGIVNNFTFTNASEISSPIEVESKRSEYAKHYLNADGTYTAIINTNPIHYLNNNIWQEIDNTLALKEGKYTNQGNALNVAFSTQTSVKSLTQINTEPMIDIDYRDFSISWDMVSVNNQNTVSEEMSQFTILPEETTDISLNSQAIETVISEDFEKLDSKAKYSSIYEGIDLEFEILPATVKETIVIDSREDIIDKFAYYIVADGLSLSLTESGTIEFSDSEGSPIFIMPKAFMFDSSDNSEYNYDIVTTLEEYAQGHLITFSVDIEWLNAVEREYPVMIDPTITLNTGIGATYVDEAYPCQNFYTSSLYYVNSTNGARKESFITAPSDISGFSIFNEVTTAYCRAKINSRASGIQYINVNMVNSAFTLGGIRYNSAQGITTTIDDMVYISPNLQQ
ncbi:MAG: hypothetical protein LBM93_00945, partial [Oscillospiraceae bacterium]|nr:hypothetical protein [Oscillospiraceae bacterium]